LIGGAYQLGLSKEASDNKFDLYQKDNEMTGLKARNFELEAATSKSDLGYKMEIDQRNNEIMDLRARLTEVEGSSSRDGLSYKDQINQRDWHGDRRHLLLKTSNHRQNYGRPKYPNIGDESAIKVVVSQSNTPCEMLSFSGGFAPLKSPAEVGGPHSASQPFPASGK
jgi:hypothetical protein